MPRFLRLWGWPIACGVLLASGLITALLSDGVGDVWSWVALGFPVAAMTWLSLRRVPRRTRDVSMSIHKEEE